MRGTLGPLLVFPCLLAVCGEGAEVTAELTRCAGIKSGVERLDCYDALAASVARANTSGAEPDASPTPTAIAVYVGPQVKNGFANTDNDVLTSVRHLSDALRKELRNDTGFRFVAEEANATIKIYVERSFGFSSSGYGASVSGTSSGATGSVYERVSQYESINAWLHVGSRKQQMFNAAVGKREKLAAQIGKDIAVWLVANRDRLSPDK